MSAHSALGPSAADRWINCPASIRLSAQVPKPPTSFDAAQGSVAHKVAEDYHDGKIDSIKLLARIGEKVRQSGHEIKITEEMVEGAFEYHDHIKADLLRLKGMGKPMEIVHKTEQRVRATSIDPRVWGTADKIVYQKGNELIVRDYKFGKGKIVEVEDNPQLMIYGIAAMDTEAGDAFNQVRLIIDQPRGRHADGTEREWVTKPKALRAWAEDVAKPAVRKVDDPTQQPVAGDWCRWCPARAVCPAMTGKAQAAAKVAFDVLPPAKAETKMEARLPEVRLMTDADLVNAFRWEEAVNSYFEAVKEVLRERLSSGVEVPGVKLVAGRSIRKWVDESEVEAKFKPVVGEKLWERKLLSPAKLEKIVGKKAGVEELTFKPEGKKSVALDSDPRPPAKSAAKDVFDVHPAESPKGEEKPSCLACDLMGACENHKKKQKPIWPQ